MMEGRERERGKDDEIHLSLIPSCSTAYRTAHHHMPTTIIIHYLVPENRSHDSSTTTRASPTGREVGNMELYDASAVLSLSLCPCLPVSFSLSLCLTLSLSLSLVCEGQV